MDNKKNSQAVSQSGTSTTTTTHKPRISLADKSHHLLTSKQTCKYTLSH